MKKLLQVVKQMAMRSGDDKSDGQLLECFIAHGDEAAFAGLVRRHGNMVLAVCRRVLQDGHDAEDAFQATFLVLARKAAAIRPREMVGNWLYGVAYRTALKAKRTGCRRRAHEAQVGEMNRSEYHDSENWQEIRPLLDQEVSRLPDKYRAPIVLCDFEGKSRKEVAQQLGWPEGTLSGRLSRARQILARRLTRRGVTLGAGTLAAGLMADAAEAAVPPVLLESTVKAGLLFAAGNSLAAGVSAPASFLAQDVLRGMILAKLKAASILLFGLLLIGTGTAFSLGELQPGPALAADMPPVSDQGENTAPRSAPQQTQDKNDGKQSDKNDGNQNEQNDGKQNDKNHGNQNQQNDSKQNDRNNGNQNQQNDSKQQDTSKNAGAAAKARTTEPPTKGKASKRNKAPSRGKQKSSR